MKPFFLTAVAVGLLVGAGAPAGEGKKDKAALQGVWKVVTVEERGRSKDDNEGTEVVFKGDEFTVRRGDSPFIKATFKLDPAKKPKQIDFQISEEKGNNVDKKAEGIYALEKDQLKLCIVEPGSGGARPTEFSAPEGTKQVYVVLKRANP